MVGERHLLVKWQLLGSLLWKAKGQDASAADAKRSLERGLKHLSEGRALDALEDFAVARFRLFDHDSYREPLVNAFDDLMDLAWRAHKGEKVSLERARQLVRRIERLIDHPEGKMAEPPRRVKTPRDARLWEMAKRIVKDNYRDIEEDSEKFWALVSRIFTRMKLRLGGMAEKDVEKIISELQEKFGALPSAGRGSKAERLVEKLKEAYRGE
jgi:plasmid stabilization system protein ParE